MSYNLSSITSRNPFSIFVFLINKYLSINRFGRGNLALFFLLSFSIQGNEMTILEQLILAHTCSLWYNGLNDICDYELDKKAYVTGFERKVLLNGSMSKLEAQFILGILLILSLLVYALNANFNITSVLLFLGGILCSIIYNLKSKYILSQSIIKYIVLDFIVSGPFFLYYLSIVFFSNQNSLDWSNYLCVGTLILGGLYGNFIYACKDLSTDSEEFSSFALYLGIRNHNGLVVQTLLSKIYLVVLYILWTVLCLIAILEGYYIAFFVFLYLCYSFYSEYSSTVPEKRQKKLFVGLSNCSMILIISFHFFEFSMVEIITLGIIALAHIVLNAKYFYNKNTNRKGLMLR